LPKRDIVRDGRIQAPKKRTDRSYLRPGAAPATPAPEFATEEPTDQADDGSEVVATAATPPVAAAATGAKPAAARAPYVGAARAIQQQGVRKRRELDVEALGRRDSSYAIHELRRIAMFAGLIFVARVVLAFVLNG
jgi:hypothetical protein